MKRVKSKVKIKSNLHSSLMKKYWDGIRSRVNDVMKIHDAFKAQMRLLSTSGTLDYRSEFIKIVNSTYGDYLGLKAQDFPDCKIILSEARYLRKSLNESCTIAKCLYYLSNTDGSIGNILIQ